MFALRLATSFAVIFGAFTLGFFVAIQGPTLMDLLDLLHVNNDIMSYSLAFANIAYAFGGLMSGFLFNYVNRQILIACFFTIFGLANIATPFISNYLIFSVLHVFKMMCAGGTDCGANVWILELWPGKDAWLQALHFSFAVGCALGPLLVEPFLSSDYKDSEMDKKLVTNGQAIINDQASETRIHIPFGISGSLSILAGAWIVWLYVIEQKRKRQQSELRAKQQAASGEHILMQATQHPAVIEAGGLEAVQLAAAKAAQVQVPNQVPPHQLQVHVADAALGPQQQVPLLAPPPPPQTGQQQQQLVTTANQAQPTNQANQQQQQQQQVTTAGQPIGIPQAPLKITSKVRDDPHRVGRPPYYVMFAIFLVALCLSFYCGIEITSINYLSSFAVYSELQVSKSTAAYMSAALTISFAVGRALGILVAAYVKPHKLFYLCAAIMALGNVFMLIFANTSEMLLWFSICLFGIGCGPMFPAIVSFYDDKVSKVTNTVSGIFILGSMFNVALNTLIIGHYIIDNAIILIVCNLVGSVSLLLLFGTLHTLTKVKKNQRVKKYRLQQQRVDNLLQQQQQQQGKQPPPSPSPSQSAAAAAAAAPTQVQQQFQVSVAAAADAAAAAADIASEQQVALQQQQQHHQHQHQQAQQQHPQQPPPLEQHKQQDETPPQSAPTTDTTTTPPDTNQIPPQLQQQAQENQNQPQQPQPQQPQLEQQQQLELELELEQQRQPVPAH